MSIDAPRATPVAPPSTDRAHISRVPYLPGLDGMRALAVIAVIVYHANPSWLSGGFLGVEMFFVISGYLITLLLIAERERSYEVSLGQFWLRRARRLLPALFLMMFLLTVWTAIFERNALGQLRGDVIAGTFYVSNWYQLWVGLGYTASGDFAPLRHLWSLAVEEQFYLLWPLVMIVLLGRGGTRRIASASVWLVAAALAITLVVALAYHPGPISSPDVTPEAYWWIGDHAISKVDALYLSSFSRAAGLLLGAAFAMVWRPYAIARGPLRRRGHVFDVLALVGFVVLVYLNWSLHLVKDDGTADSRLFRGGFLVVVLATLAMISAVTHRGAFANRMLGTPILLWIGLRSYGLYLYHWPIFQIFRGTAGNTLSLGQFVVAMAITVVVAELSYRYVETPIRAGKLSAWVRRARASADPRPRRRLVAGGAIVTAMTLLAGTALARADLRQNEIAEDLAASEEFSTDLTSLSPAELEALRARSSVPTTAPSRPSAPTTERPTPTTAPRTTVASVTTAAGTATTVAGATTVPPTTVPATTVPPTTAPVVPATTVAPAPVTQLGVVTDMSTVTPLYVPPRPTGIPLVALGDSVMLGAAEELGARGILVNAQVSRQMVSFLPEMQAIKDAGTFGSVVIVHLGTNGSFSQATLDQMMAILADVPVVIALTGKADRGWVAGNNAKIRALPATYPNTTVLDWEVLGPQCPGDCFYTDNIHLNQAGQNYYAGLVARLIGLT
jgi:peptidoglycan/LPS O-acetylase OafA/YrhL